MNILEGGNRVLKPHYDQLLSYGGKTIPLSFQKTWKRRFFKEKSYIFVFYVDTAEVVGKMLAFYQPRTAEIM